MTWGSSQGQRAKIGNMGKLARSIVIGYISCKLAAWSGEEFLQKELIDDKDPRRCSGTSKLDCQAL